MSRQKKSRKITDIMPARKTEKTATPNTTGKKGRKPTRYELDAKAREEKRKKKHKGLPAGHRHSSTESKQESQQRVTNDPRIGSRKKVALVVEMVNNPEKGQFIKPVQIETQVKQQKVPLDPNVELEQLENNECLNQLLDQLEQGKTLTKEDQQFVDECLSRIEQLMQQLGLEDEDDSEESLYRTFNNIDINQFR